MISTSRRYGAFVARHFRFILMANDAALSPVTEISTNMAELAACQSTLPTLLGGVKDFAAKNGGTVDDLSLQIGLPDVRFLEMAVLTHRMLLENSRSEASPDAERSLEARSHVGALAPHHFSNSTSPFW